MLGKLVVLITICSVVYSDRCPNDKKCLSCDGNNCNFCHKSYLSSGECKKPDQEIPHCLSYFDANNCRACELGYHLNHELQKCEKISIKNCFQVDIFEPETCILCGGNVTVMNNTCDLSNPKCSENCEMCFRESCAFCAEGYSINKQSGCIQEPGPGCSSAFLDETKCDFCKEGYYHTGEECKESDSINIINLIVNLLIVMNFL